MFSKILPLDYPSIHQSWIPQKSSVTHRGYAVVHLSPVIEAVGVTSRGEIMTVKMVNLCENFTPQKTQK